MSVDENYKDISFSKVNGRDINEINGNISGLDYADGMGVYLYPTVLILKDGVEHSRTIGVASSDEYWYNLDIEIDRAREL